MALELRKGHMTYLSNVRTKEKLTKQSQLWTFIFKRDKLQMIMEGPNFGVTKGKIDTDIHSLDLEKMQTWKN